MIARSLNALIAAIGINNMAYKIKVTPKPVPSEHAAAIHWLDRWVMWETAHRRLLWPLVIGGACVIMAAGGGWGWWWWQNNQAAQLAGQAAEYYPAPTEAAKPAPAGEQMKSPMAERCEKALPLYRQITDRYGHSRLAPLAMYYQANCQVELGKFDDAQALYTSVIDRYGPANAVAQLAALRLGYLYAHRGDRTRAIQQFQQLSQQPTASNRDEALYEVGRLREAENDREGALATYKAVQKEFSKSPWSSEAAARIKSLGGETANTPPSATIGPAPAGVTPSPSSSTTAAPGSPTPHPSSAPQAGPTPADAGQKPVSASTPRTTTPLPSGR
ncbi:MAG TPA: tetratricopeptide repeat protein [Nitrospiria bacterium]|nr:tetratricopeptide repeat protein [Nitrospiria bacterium]